MGRYAVLLSGQPRYRDYVIQNLLTNLILPNNCDVFGFFWSYDRDSLQKFVWNIPVKHVVQRDVDTITHWEENISQIVSSIPFTKIQVCPQIEFPQNRFAPGEDEKNGAQDIGQEMFEESVKRWNFSTQSHFYSVWAVNQLKKQYEEEHGFRYDGVIRLRTDVIFYHPINLTLLDPTKITLPMNYDRDHKGDIVVRKCDFVSYGSSELMDIYCDYYQNLDWVFSQPYGEICCNEKHLVKYLCAFLPEKEQGITYSDYNNPHGFHLVV